ncbi:MAG TPA: hypothetical protein VHI75_06975, partial [Casimicrobiaceae bacterium]|nr:hypothetical protein [Casimicrobiaceae bacterium]
ACGPSTMLAPVSAALERPRLSPVSARPTIHAKLRGAGPVESADGQCSTPNGKPALRYIVALHQITMAISTREVQLKMLMEIIVFRDNPSKPWTLGKILPSLHASARRPQRAGTVQKKGMLHCDGAGRRDTEPGQGC